MRNSKYLIFQKFYFAITGKQPERIYRGTPEAGAQWGGRRNL